MSGKTNAQKQQTHSTEIQDQGDDVRFAFIDYSKASQQARAEEIKKAKSIFQRKINQKSRELNEEAIKSIFSKLVMHERMTDRVVPVTPDHIDCMAYNLGRIAYLLEFLAYDFQGLGLYTETKQRSFVALGDGITQFIEFVILAGTIAGNLIKNLEQERFIAESIVDLPVYQKLIGA